MTEVIDITDDAPKKKGPNLTPLKKAQADFQSLKSLHEAQCVAVKQIEDDNERLRARIIYLETTLTNVERMVDINKTILANAITTHQEQSNGYAVEIKLLKEKIAELKG